MNEDGENSMVTNPMGVLQRENARLHDENETLRKELGNMREFVQTLNELNVAAREIQSDKELFNLLEIIFRKALNLLNAPDGSLLMLDDETNELAFVMVQGTLAQHLIGYRIPADDGIAGWVIANGQPTLVRDARRDPRFSQTIDDQFTFRTQSILAAPLIGDRRVFGVLEALNQPGDEPFSEADMALVGLLCRFAGEALADIERTHPENV